jgi:hypothetical protein
MNSVDAADRLPASAGTLGRVVPLVRVLALASVPLMLIAGYLLAFDGAALNIGNPRAAWDYSIALLWSVALLAGFLLLPVSAAHKKALVVLWVVRIGVVLGFMLFYESHYGLDAYMYFSEGARRPDAWRDIAFGQGTANMIALSSWHQVLVPASYHAMKLTCAAVGLLAVYVFYRAGCLLLGREDVRILYLLGLVPSVMFWGSILGKDPITLLGIAVFVYGILAYVRRRGVGNLVLALAGLALAASLRLWLAAIFLLPLGVFLVAGRGGIGRKVLLAAFVVPALLWSFTLVSERFRIESSLDFIDQTDRMSQSWSHGGSGQELEGGLSDAGAVLGFMPLGAFTALFRPLPGEVMNAFGLLAGLENLALLAVFALSLFNGRWRRLTSPEVAWLAVTVVVWASIYGFASYQNLGTAFRFKVQVMPLLVLLCLVLRQREPLPSTRARTGPRVRGPAHA